jgi:hypothetical protein
MPPDTEIAAVLSRFPGPLTLYPSRREWLLVFTGCLLVAAGGAWMIKSGDGEGWLVLIFFGLGTLVAGAAMLPGAGGLILDHDGFEITNLFRRHRTRWQDAAGFQTASVPRVRQKMVVYDDITQRAKSIAKINVALVGRNAALPDTYGFSAEDLAQVMTQWRERTLGRTVSR